MPVATVGNVPLRYEILGNEGPFIALVSGARRSLDEVKGLATQLSNMGHRVLLHDRRNTGLSGLSLAGDGSEFEIWADDLDGLISTLGLPPMIVGGSSSGCRLATIMTQRHRPAITGLVMMRVTGGAFAVNRLARIYYTQYIEAAQRDGMAAVCDTDHFRDLIALVPARKREIMSWDAGEFIATMTRWRASLESGINDPMLGASETALRAMDFAVCVMPGNDKTHSIAAGRAVQKLIPGAELHELRTDQLDDDLISFNEWAADDVLAKVIADFCRRVTRGS